MSSLKEREELLKKYEELKNLCEVWDEGCDAFASIVSFYLELDLSHLYEMQHAFGPNVARWGKSFSYPSFVYQKEVVLWILRRAKWKIRVLSNMEEVIKELEQHHKNNKGR